MADTYDDDDDNEQRHSHIEEEVEKTPAYTAGEDDVWAKRAAAIKAAEEAGQASGSTEQASSSSEPARSRLGQAERSAGGSDTLGRGYTDDYTPNSKDRNQALTNVLKGFGKNLKGLSWRKKAMAFGVTTSIVTGIVGGFAGFGGFLNVFQMDHLLSNIEAKGFLRYQVDMEGRSNKWISTYLLLRMAEVSDPRLKPADRDNILFRANTPGFMENPKLATWYKLLRGSDFEQDLWDNDGMRIGSIAYRDGDIIKFRTAIITIRGEAEVRFEPNRAELDAIDRGDINGFNNRLREFIDVEIIHNDREARRRIREVVHSRTRPWQVLKRYYLRKAIQNMTGVRDWRFYDLIRGENVEVEHPDGSTTTESRRNQRAEAIQRMRNQIVRKMLPEGTRAGKFVQCLFGLSECRGSPDPADPDNRSNIQPPTTEECSSSSTNARCNTGRTDADGNPIVDDGSTSDGVSDGVRNGADEDLTETFSRKLMKTIISKIGGLNTLIGMLDQIKKLHVGLTTGGLTSIIIMARYAGDMNIFATYGMARDQMRNGGEVSAEQVDLAMSILADNGGNGEGWERAIAPEENSLVSAAGESAADDSKIGPNQVGRKEFCSAAFQAKLTLPQNEEAAKAQYAYICKSDKLGAADLAKTIEDGYKESIGYIIGPIVALYDASGLSIIYGWLDSATAFLGEITGKITSSILAATGYKDEFDNLIGWVLSSIMNFAGGGPRLPEGAPPNMYVNHAIMGAAAASESNTRQSGGIAPTPEMRKEKEQAVAAYLQEKDAHMSLYEKYASLSNQQSAASNALFAILDQGIGKTFSKSLASILNMPATILGGTAHAADQTSGAFAVADISGAQPFVIPPVCNNIEPTAMTIANATNADDLGLIPTEDLNWDMLTESTVFYDRLYEDKPDPNKAMQVYNCALWDAIISGAVGGVYAPETIGANGYGGALAGPSGGTIAAGTSFSKAQLRENSQDTECAPGSTKVKDTTGYADGAEVPLRLCRIDGWPSSSDESRPTSDWYVEGANGMVLVNSRASGYFVELFKQFDLAKKGDPSTGKVADPTLKNVTLKATSSFRTMPHQKALCAKDTKGCAVGNYIAVGKPGFSNHQMGNAIDIQMPSISNSRDNCTYVAGLCAAPKDPLYIWLHANGGGTPKLEQYADEFWHWEPAVLHEK